ncbi:hypothetical protein [Rhizobium sp. P32RR-XVIII]|uniref:hypothetical protein n=1 Tax=Rhizobium sp. P32RR-XVIII TaxID=2726738 RepID=UPI001980F766|nr:hypothetical protein [Rhizobium sp. P32RR-XVIII]
MYISRHGNGYRFQRRNPANLVPILGAMMSGSAMRRRPPDLCEQRPEGKASAIRNFGATGGEQHQGTVLQLPDLKNAIMDAFAAHEAMSKQDSEKVREGLNDVLFGPGQLYEHLRERGEQLGAC